MSVDNSFAILLEGVAGGDSLAAACVFRQFYGRLCALARVRLHPLLRGKEDAEDIVQSVYRSFFCRHAAEPFQICDQDGLWAVLSTIAVRKCINRREYFRAQRRDVARERASTKKGLGTAADDVSSLISLEAVSREPTPEEVVAVTETVEALLSRFDGVDRSIAVLLLQGCSHHEIAGQVDRATRTVRRVAERLRGLAERLIQNDE